MSGHVIYSCACLNIKLHLANKYLLEQHHSDLAEAFVRLDDPPLEGWEFQLGIGGVQAEYNALIRARAIDDNWMTIECLNCSTGAVYSVERRPLNAIVSYPVDIQDLYRPGDRVLIHKRTLYGPELEKIKQQSNYSSQFGIVLNQDASQVFEEDEEKVPGDLYMAHTQLGQILETSLKRMQAKTEERIERFRIEQLRELETTSDKVKYDRQALWHKILEASRAVHDEEIKAKTTSTARMSPASSSHVRFAEEGGSSSNRSKNSGQEAQPAVAKPSSSNIPTSSSSQQQQKMFLKSSSLRSHPSFGFDEYVVSSSLKLQQQHPSSPLATAAVVEPDDDDDKEDDESIGMDDDDDDDGMFDLDEAIEAGDAEEDPKGKGKHVDLQQQQSWAKRRTSSKYISAFEDDNEEEDQHPETDNHDTLSTSVSAYATSLPIAISYDHKPRSFTPTNENAVNPADQDPTTITGRAATATTESSSSNTNTKNNTPHLAKSLVNFNHFSHVDQEASLLFPTQRRRSIAVARAASRPQLDSLSLIGRSLDTRSNRSETNNKDDDDGDDGPMIPPHVLAARTYNNETEELFGAIPRSNTWRKTLE